MYRDFKENFFENENFDENLDESLEAIDEFLEYYKSLPKPTVTIINPEKYLTMITVANRLKKLLAASFTEGKINISLSQEFFMGSIIVETSLLTVENTKEFAEIILKADNFEIVPLTNGNISLGITFHRVLKPIC